MDNLVHSGLENIQIIIRWKALRWKVVPQSSRTGEKAVCMELSPGLWKFEIVCDSLASAKRVRTTNIRIGGTSE